MAQTLVGDLKEFNLNDILQLLSMAHQTGALQITRGNNRGAIYFDNGIPVHARTSGHTGESAIYDIFTWTEGKFYFNDDTTDERTIQTSLQNIIMEAARRIDEWERVRDVIPTMDIVIEFNPHPQQGSENISLEASEWRVLSLVNGARTVKEIASQSDFDDFETCKILYGLLSSGLLKAIEETETPAALARDVAQLEKPKSESEETPAPKVTEAESSKGESRKTGGTGIKFLERILGTSRGKENSDQNEPKNPAGIVANFINELLQDYETPQGLYGAIRLRKPFEELVFSLKKDNSILADVVVENNRLQVMKIDQAYPSEKIETYEVYQLFKEIIQIIYEDARKSLSPRSATRRYQDVFSRFFVGERTLEKLGLEDFIDRKRLS